MKNKKAIIMVTLIISILIVGTYYILGDKDKLEDKYIKEKSGNIYVEDFLYAYQVLEEHYPYMEINRDMNGIDWLDKKEEYRNKVEDSTSDEEFFLTMSNIIEDLNNGHTSIISEDNGIKSYFNYGRDRSWKYGIYEKIIEPVVLDRYGYSMDIVWTMWKMFSVEIIVKVKYT